MPEALTEALGGVTEPRAGAAAGRVRPAFLRRRLVWLGGFVLLVVGGSLVAGALKGGAGKGQRSLTAKVKRGDLEVVVLETGRVEPLLQTQIKSKVGGQVTAVLVQEGQKVKQGQVLLRIDPTEYQRELARADADVVQAREQLAFAIIQLRRAEKASTSAIAPAAELDQFRHEAAMARARLKTALVSLETARDHVRYTEIEAPFDGTVIQRNIQPGEVVIPGMTATVEGRAQLVLADMSVLLVKTDLNQIDVAQVQKGQTAEITLDALPGKKFTGTVTRVAAAAASVNGRDAFPIEAALAAAQDLSAIKPGMTADVRVLIEKRPKVLLLPIEAVISEGGKNHVVVMDPQAGSKVATPRDSEVEVGARNDREVEIKSGLDEGTEVLIKPPAVKNDGEVEIS